MHQLFNWEWDYLAGLRALSLLHQGRQNSLKSGRARNGSHGRQTHYLLTHLCGWWETMHKWRNLWSSSNTLVQASGGNLEAPTTLFTPRHLRNTCTLALTLMVDHWDMMAFGLGR